MNREEVLRAKHRERQHIKQSGGGRELASALLKRPTATLDDKGKVTSVIPKQINKGGMK